MPFIKIDNKETFKELHFSQHFIKHCPQLNLLSLVNETELVKEFTLIVSLAASDAVQVTLSPSTTEIDVIPTTTHFVLTSPQPSSTALLTMGTAVTQCTEASLDTLIAAGIGALLVLFITTVISCTVIAACYSQSAKTRRMVTNAVEASMFQMGDHSCSGVPCVNTAQRKK